MTEEILETALDFVQTKEQAEGERIDQAHALLESALRQEGILEDAVDEAHNDALDAHEEMLKRVSSEDKEMRREMAVIDISHGVEDYATERLHEAQDMEAKAKEEEQEAMKNLAELQRKQDELKTALESTKMMEWDEKLQNM